MHGMTFEKRYEKLIVTSAVTAKAGSGMFSHDHIEHRQPKSKFRDKTFDWDNLHLSCPKCNIKKGSKWCETAPILDAVIDRPIDEHLTYETGPLGVRRWPTSPRGKTTVEHTDLNRDGWVGLPGTRGKIYLEARSTIRKLKENLGAPEAGEVRRELEEKSRGPYGSVIAFALAEAGL